MSTPMRPLALETDLGTLDSTLSVSIVCADSQTIEDEMATDSTALAFYQEFLGLPLLRGVGPKDFTRVHVKQLNV